MKTFKELGVHEDFIKGLEGLKITHPTEIQELTIPILLNSNTDLVAQAQTGTGKTAAFGLPLLQKINASLNHIQGLILCPTRELAQQIAKQNQPIIQQAQPNSGPNWDALSNYGRCLGTQGETFSSCSNAWQGYTPPRKTVTKCRYDSFGNVITGTCTTQ